MSTFLKKLERQKYLLILVIPFMLLLIIFSYIPMFGLIGAFQDYQPTKGFLHSDWVGLKFFKDFISGYFFKLLLKNTVGISFLKILFGFPAPIILALFLNELRTRWFKRTVQTISYLPYFVSWVVVLGILGRLLSPDGGIINNILAGVFGYKDPIVFMQESKYMWGLAVITDIWKNLGMNTILYMAALASINSELYEAAEIDGANRWQKMLYITWPGIRPTVAILFIFTMGSLFSDNFEQMWMLGNAITVRASTEVFDTYIMREGLLNANYSIGIAAGLMLNIVNFFILFIINRAVKLLGEEGIW